ALHIAVDSGLKTEVERVLEEHTDPDIKCPYGWTPLQRAAYRGYYQILDTLLHAGANCNSEPGDHGLTALQAAADSGNMAIVERLLEAGADVNANPCEELGRTALQAAADGGHLDIVERLLDAGAHVN
ncbi:ankyrin, partial [Wilcoxina mikolae CBS 423.85]